MARRKIIRVSLAGLMALMVLSLLVSSLSAVTPSATNDCKEVVPGSSKKVDAGMKNDIDFETLSGRFFS